MQSKDALAREPLNILVNPELIKRQKPWQIDIVYLLNLFKNLIAKLESVDLRLCGSAALSSALIYRLKVEALFLSERLSEGRRPLDLSDIPFILSMPIRYELHASTLEDLITALQKLIDEITSREEPEKPKRLSREPILEIDQFINRLREGIEPFKASLIEILRLKGSTLFSELTLNKSQVEAARIFILLLFLASDRLVFLEQLEEDLLIKGAAELVG